MMTLRIALDAIVANQRSAFSEGPRLPKTLKVERLAQKIGAVGRLVTESALELDQLKAYFFAAVESRTLDVITRAAWDRLPSVLWYGDGQQLGDLPEVLSSFEAHIKSRTSTRCLRRCFATYFRQFQPGNSQFVRFAEIIDKTVRRQSVALRPWLESIEQYQLFSPPEAPSKIAIACLSDDCAAQKILDDAGRGYIAISSAFALASLHAALSIVRETLPNGALAKERLRRASTWINLRAQSVPLTIDTQIVIGLSLLSPWLSARPSDELRKLMTETLLTHVGDPRKGDAVWQLPQLAAVKPTLLSWLAYGTIEQFFEVIDASAMAGHWSERRSFWASYAAQGVVTDAWVAYGPVPYNLARKSGYPKGSFGELQGAKLRDHSALLLRIGALVIVDFSHNGKCQFYSNGATPPEFYLERYDDNRLRWDSSDALTHQGYWQGKFAQFIRTHTGIRSNYESRW